MKALNLTLSTLVLSCILAGCSNGPSVNDSTLRMRLIGEPQTLDWNRASTPIESHLLMNLLEGLVGLDRELRTVPAAAKKWELTDGNRRYVFHLDSRARWSDGKDVRAQDFVASWRRLLSPETASPYAYALFDLVGAKDFHSKKASDFSRVGVRAIDDRTLEVRLEHPTPHFLSLLSFWVTFPIREDLVTLHKEKFTTPAHWVSNGPYILTEHVTESKVVMTTNPYYREGPPPTSRIEALVISDHSTALSLYETGQLDFLTDLAPMDLPRLKGRSDLKAFPYLKTVYLGFAVKNGGVSSASVRRAIGAAIDRSPFPGLLQGGQVPADGFLPPQLRGKISKPSVPRKTDTGTLPRKLSLVVQNWDKNLIVAQYIQEALRSRLGIEVEILALDHKAYLKQTQMQTHDLFLRSWSADFPAPDNFFSLFLSDSGNNRTGWGLKTYDDWVNQARHESSPSARTTLYEKAEKLLVSEEAAIFPLYYEPNVALVSPQVTGVELTPLNGLELKKAVIRRAKP